MKKILLSIGMLVGLSSVASASCTYSLQGSAWSDRVIKNFSIMPNSYGEVKYNGQYFYNAILLSSDENCNILVYNSNGGYHSNQNKITTFIKRGDTKSIANTDDGTDAGMMISLMLTNTSSAPSGSSAEIEALRNEINQLKNTVYSCVQ